MGNAAPTRDDKRGFFFTKKFGKMRDKALWAFDVWLFYRDADGEWRWRRTSRNHKKVGFSQGYKSLGECKWNAQRHGYEPGISLADIEAWSAE